MKYPYYIVPVIVLEKIKLKGEPQSQAKLQEKALKDNDPVTRVVVIFGLFC